MKKQAAPRTHKVKASRGNPEGNSIMQKQTFKIPSVPKMSGYVDGTSVRDKKKRKSSMNLDDIEDSYLAKRSKMRNRTVSEESVLDQSTPETLSQISSIMPVSDLEITTVTLPGKRLKGRADVTWEQAVRRARGQPDGAEKSFHRKKSSVSLKDEVQVSKGMQGKENAPSNGKSDQPFQRKKSFKVKVQTAARKLKSLKKPTLSQSRIAAKKKFEETLPDETVMKRPKIKDMTWKERRQARRMNKNNFSVIQKAKQVWEQLRKQNLPEDKRHQMCQELYDMIKDKVNEMAFAHDTARIIQCLVQYGSPDLRSSLMDNIKDTIVPLCKSKYGKFIIRKVLKYGSKQQRNFVFKSLHGHVRRLVRHREASEVVEYAYNNFANASQRLGMLEEFYGPSFTLFKTQETKTLDQIMAAQPDKKEMILSNMKEALLPLIDKEILIHSLVHRVFFEFFCYAPEKMRTEMIEALREGLVHMLHTRDGARVTMFCVWHGTAKDRKVIIKSLKTHVVKICKEEYGHLVLLAIFDVVDDTKIVQKIILDEMLKSVEEVATDLYGRKVLLYLLSPRDPIHFHPAIVQVLQEGDGNFVSKKDATVRHSELLEHVSPKLLEYLERKTKELVTNNATLLLVLAIITHATGDLSDVMEAIALIAAEPFTAGAAGKYHIIEDSAGHLAVKRLILQDQDRLKAGKTPLFSTVLLENLPENALKAWAACNRGCFILLSLLELGDTEVEQAVTEQLAAVKKSLKKMTMKGPQLLLQKLESLTCTRAPAMIDL